MIYIVKRMRTLTSNILNRGLAVFGLQIRKVHSGIWNNDKEFLSTYSLIKDRTLVRIDRSYALYQFAKSASVLKGDIAQVGVYRGGTAKMLASLFVGSSKRFYLFDTFEGLPEASQEDGLKNVEGNGKREFNDVDFNEIRSYFSDIQNIEFKKGLFPETAKGLEDKRFCFVYLDADLYSSTRDGLSFFYSRMIPGGVIMFDDYETNTWPGVAKAVREFCDKENIYPVRTASCQGMIVKG